MTNTPHQNKRTMTNQAIHVVLSCETLRQLETARKYCNLAIRRYMIDSYDFQKIRDVFNRKLEELRP